MNFKPLIRIAKDTKYIIDTKQRHFSFILLRSNVISFGWNQSWKTHPLAARYNHRFNNIHSELAAIKNMQMNWSVLEKCTMINIRIKPDGGIGLSKPCKYCQRLVRDFNIGKLLYSDDSGNFQEFQL